MSLLSKKNVIIYSVILTIIGLIVAVFILIRPKPSINYDEMILLIDSYSSEELNEAILNRGIFLSDEEKELLKEKIIISEKTDLIQLLASNSIEFYFSDLELAASVGSIEMLQLVESCSGLDLEKEGSKLINRAVGGILSKEGNKIDTQSSLWIERHPELEDKILAAKGPHMDLVNWLVENGAMDIYPPGGLDPTLDISVFIEDPLDYPVHSVTPVSLAAYIGSLDAIKELNTLGYPFLVDDQRYQISPFWTALIEDHDEIVQYCHYLGASINQKYPVGTLFYSDTPLLVAAYFNSYKTIDYLMRAGSYYNYQNEKKEGALHIAVKNDNIESVEALIAGGAYINLRDSDGRTALSLAVKMKKTEIVKKMLEMEAPIDFTDHQHRTELFWAVETGNLQVAELLLNAGAEPEGGKISYSNPLARARELEMQSMVELLEKFL